jgi:UDP-2,3-diacylglucosamine pyrophosphatase LpxH
MVPSSRSELKKGLQDSKHRQRVAEALDQAWQRALAGEKSVTLDVDLSSARFVIFSDQHKGVRNRADDFLGCERAYNAALAYYFAAGHTLIELGDVEELWEERPGTVLDKYKHTLELSAKFHRAGRYLRVYGNHDDNWSFDDEVSRLLRPIYGADLKVYESIRLRDRELGTLWLTHGHQGTMNSDRFSRLSRIPTRFLWRPLQRLFKLSLNSPAKDWVLREKHNIALYSWARSKPDLVLIAGHTHRPVFRAKTLAAQIEEELTKTAPHEIQRIAELSAELEWVRAQDQKESGPEGAVVPLESPSYFNTGCCCFVDGDITGIEIADGEIRLIRWPDDEDRPKPQILRGARLRIEEVFSELS